MSIKCLLNLSVISSIYCYCRQWSDGQVLLRHGLRQGARHWDRDLSGDRTLEQGGARLSHARMSGIISFTKHFLPLNIFLTSLRLTSAYNNYLTVIKCLSSASSEYSAVVLTTSVSLTSVDISYRSISLRRSNDSVTTLL